MPVFFDSLYLVNPFAINIWLILIIESPLLQYNGKPIYCQE